MIRHRANTTVFLAIMLVCHSLAARQLDNDFQHAIAEFRAGNYSSAAEDFARAEAASPGATDALLYEAKCFIHLENFPGAEKALRSYVAAHRQSAEALYLLGFGLHRQNRPAESLTAFTQAAALSPPTSDDLKIVGLDYVLLGDYPDAIKWLDKAVEFDATNKEAWYYLGRAYYTKALFPEARKAFQKLLELDPRNARAENNLGLILETEGQSSAALDAYRSAIAWQEQSGHLSEQPYVNLGNLLLEQGQTKEAFHPLQKAADLAPRNAYCHLKLGTYYRKVGMLEDAKVELESATQIEPDNAAIHYQLGRLYKETHALDRAQAEFDRAAELQSRAARSKSSPPTP
jgi:tetratricopeptide (TPR) repeat protein